MVIFDQNSISIVSPYHYIMTVKNNGFPLTSILANKSISWVVSDYLVVLISLIFIEDGICSYANEDISAWGLHLFNPVAGGGVGRYQSSKHPVEVVISLL